ncbi:MAG: hypothetical protein P4L80_18120 [Xanthobacteraceae bacterium]|nr:hypothetical protein [Xanthobacteraceae bacterium]
MKMLGLSAAIAAAFALTPACAHAQDAFSVPVKAPSPSPYPGYDPINPYVSWQSYQSFQSWLTMVSATQHAQPSWMTPLVTVTPRLEQEYRSDFYSQKNGTGSQGNGQQLENFGGPGGNRLEIIPAYNLEAIVALPSYVSANGPKGDARGWGDYPMFLFKYRFMSANEQSGNYIVTAFFQMSDPLGTPAKISNNILTAQPTLAFGKGWGDFDIQMTVSTQIPVSALASPGNTPSMNMANFGDPILWNTTFQYHFFEYLWPEFEVNYTYYPNGEHSGLSQVLLTPGIIFGRFKIGMDSPTRPINLIVGAGYQFAVTPNPVIQNNFVGTVRVTF